jgi:type IV pilus assembly protein PilN
MIRISINLATEPFRKTRAALVGYVAGAAALAILLVVQVVYIVNQRGQAADLRATKNTLTAELASINSRQAKINSTLRQPENAAVLEESVFLNALIERKSISWTRLFSDLAQVVPYDVRLISVRLPQIDSRNHVELDMVVGATDPAPIIELLRKLEGSPAFGSTAVISSMPPGQNEQLYRYRLTVSYAQKF